ncbi:type-F conjugative transfer system pilin assembly protein TrbC (plasmid) [Cereibacter azotoformans]|uniref:type-F conjugative transfer system pilin assembly protein TrbC n=1 Tax=Cereibacter azotoformans TaxID=43057 RepID=UPI001EECA093|nr:type-F conjugative transfer system pilin assembly protein TrbC [Cereibacter azotoformans]ULB12509.1 type-F conjugative transfer system pilin assembly protein TrbC [Cereibacter azotoformans]
MAHLAQTQLLRALIAAAVLSAGAARAGDELPDPAFAPGATGRIAAPVDRIVRDAERRGEALARELTIQPPREDVEIEDLAGIRTRALNDPRVRALLGAPDAEEVAAEVRARYGETRAILFASFSMPDTSLRQMMREATAHDLTVVFRGFVNNSVFDTRARLEEVFAEDETGEAFGIDPTLFRRFDIRSVPALVVLAEDLGDCATPACESDPPPRHDRVSGNVPLETALRVIAAGNGEAASVARSLLEQKP